ncbi:hypothetical protein AB8Q18_11050 [Neisseriaceae bacterium CLB008]
MMTKIHYCLILLLPAALYYLGLAMWPQHLTQIWLGWPLSVLLGLFVMAWAVLVGLWFAHRAVAAGVGEEGEHD